MHRWPYFFDTFDYAAVRIDAPVPVFTCWNGVAIFDADPLLPTSLRSNRTLSHAPLASALPQTHPAASAGPVAPADAERLRFRASALGECYSSECFLLPYDLRRQFGLERVYVNPRVRVAYTWKHYVWFHFVQRHWAVRWWVERVWGRTGLDAARRVIGDPRKPYEWDGVDCHPWDKD